MADQDKYYGGHGDMGPADLKDAKCPQALVGGYDALGTSNMTVDEWRDYYHPKRDPNGPDAEDNREWKWPPGDGFYIDPTSKQEVRQRMTVFPGMLVDRFGGDDTAFFCTFGTSFAMRSLFGGMLDTDWYEVYRVLKPFEADGGPAASWFGQPGMGLQLEAVKYASAKEMLDTPENKEENRILHKLTKDERIALAGEQFWNGLFGDKDSKGVETPDQ